MRQFAPTAEQQLMELKNSYLKKIPSMILELDQLCSLLSSEKDPRPILIELKRKAHSFIGSSGTFDFHDLSKKIRDFEQILLSIEEAPSRVGTDKQDKLHSHLVAIKGLAQRITSIQNHSEDSPTNVRLLHPNRPLNILFAGDDKEIQTKFLFDLSDSKHSVSFAENGKEAISKFNEFEFDLVVLEIVMPVMDGFQTATEIKKNSKDKHTPILFLTSANRENDLVKCIESGGDDFLVKPYQPGILNAKIFSLDRMSQLINREN